MSLLFKMAPTASLLALLLGVAGCLAPEAEDADADPTAAAAEADHLNHGPIPPVLVGNPRGGLPVIVGGPVVVSPPFEGPRWTGPGRPPPWWGRDGWDGPPGHRHPHHPH